MSSLSSAHKGHTITGPCNAGLGDFIIDPPWSLQPRSFKTWDVHMVLQDVGADSEFQPARIGEGHELAGAIDVFALEVGSSRMGR